MKSIFIITSALVVLAITSIVTTTQSVTAFNERNNNFVSNDHNHLRIGDFEGGPEAIQSSSGGQFNDENTHSSFNYNSERGENTGDENYQKDNTFTKPDNNNDDEPETETTTSTSDP
jgi:hypothetical protein